MDYHIIHFSPLKLIIKLNLESIRKGIIFIFVKNNPKDLFTDTFYAKYFKGIIIKLF